MSLIPLAILVALFVWNCFHVDYATPATPPQRPSEPSDAGGAIGAAVGLVVTLASCCWLLVCLAVFLAPLGLLVMWVLR